MTLVESKASSFLFTRLDKLSVIQHGIQIRRYKEYILLGLPSLSPWKQEENKKEIAMNLSQEENVSSKRAGRALSF